MTNTQNNSLKTDLYTDFLARYEDVKRLEIRRGVVMPIFDPGDRPTQQMWLDLYELQNHFDKMVWHWSTKDAITMIIEPEE